MQSLFAIAICSLALFSPAAATKTPFDDNVSVTQRLACHAVYYVNNILIRQLVRHSRRG